MPKRGDQNVLVSGIRTWPRAASTAKARSASASVGTASESEKPPKLVQRQISFVTPPAATVGRVTPCAPRFTERPRDGAHGVTRPTRSRNLIVAVLADACLVKGGNLARELADEWGQANA